MKNGQKKPESEMEVPSLTSKLSFCPFKCFLKNLKWSVPGVGSPLGGIQVAQVSYIRLPPIHQSIFSKLRTFSIHSIQTPASSCRFDLSVEHMKLTFGKNSTNFWYRFTQHMGEAGLVLVGPKVVRQNGVGRKYSIVQICGLTDAIISNENVHPISNYFKLA